MINNMIQIGLGVLLILAGIINIVIGITWIHHAWLMGVLL